MATYLTDGKILNSKCHSNSMSSSSSISSRSRHISRSPSLQMHCTHGEQFRPFERTPSMPTTSGTPNFNDNNTTTEYTFQSHSFIEEEKPDESDFMITTRHNTRQEERFLKHASSAPPSSFLHYTSALGSICQNTSPKIHSATLGEASKDIPTAVRVDTIDETSPLLDKQLGCSSQSQPKTAANSIGQGGFVYPGHEETGTTEELYLSRIAVAYLLDFIDSRPPTLPPDSDNVTMTHLSVHWVRFSIFWRLLIGGSIVSLFVASSYETGRNNVMLALCTFIPVFIFVIDMLMMGYLFDGKAVTIVGPAKTSPRLLFYGSSDNGGSVQAYRSTTFTASAEARKSRSRWWALPLIAFLFVLSVETIFLLRSNRNDRTTPRGMLMISVCKPVVLFYASPKARNALDAMNRVARIVFKVIFIELFVIFTFAALACQLYGEEFALFGSLQMSFLTMLEISTLVATPSPWMPIYNRWHSSATFFVFYLVVCVFYLHSLVLSVVFQSYMESLMIIREHASHDKEENLRLAFQTLYRVKSQSGQNGESVGEPVRITTKSIRNVLILMRPHYSRKKIDTLIDIVDPTHHGTVDYNSFRARLPKAMVTTVKTLRSFNNCSLLMHTFAIFLAMANFVYTIVASSPYNGTWWKKIVLPAGSTVTVLSIIELFIRLLPFCKYRIPEAVRPNIAFDGIAILAVIVSTIGIVMSRYDYGKSLDWMITGRALDLARCIRLATEARGIVKRSGEIFPYVVGPVVLVFTSLHIFTCTGQAIWGGKIEVGSNPNLTPYYDLNNFNSYSSGMLTMFQMLVANDWHLLAEVFILPTHTEANKFVYPFFISSILILVSVLLNVLTAFFVGAFITKTPWKSSKASQGNRSRDSITPGMMPIIETASNMETKRPDISPNTNNNFKITASNNNITLSERPEFDTMMRNVAGKVEDEDDAAKNCCHLLELFEHLAIDGTNNVQIGYLVSCHHSMSRYGNQRFQDVIHIYMSDDAMHKIISEMQAELSKSLYGHEIVVSRTFSEPLCKDSNHTKQTLELTASVLKEGSSVALFVAKFL